MTVELGGTATDDYRVQTFDPLTDLASVQFMDRGFCLVILFFKNGHISMALHHAGVVGYFQYPKNWTLGCVG